MMLSVRNLTKVFDTTVAVNKLSFDLDAGRICGFVGPNGAGKTSTMRIIATIDEPTFGSVSIDGESILEQPYRTRRKIGFMPDHYGAYPDLTCEDYLEFFARAYEIEPSKRPARIGEIMEFTGLDKIRDKKVETLSKGMRQRLNLSRALVNDPDLLIMDEPAAGLDPRARVELRYLMKALAKLGKTIFVSSHILTELSETCDSMLIIDQGRLVTFGSFEEIQRDQQKDCFDIAIRLLDEEKCEALERFLLERASCAEPRVDEGALVHFTLNAPREDIPALLNELVAAGFPIVEFHPSMMSMEEVFMRITDENGEGKE